MNTLFDNSYGRDLKKIADKKRKAEIKKAVLSVRKSQTVKNIPRLKKLKGYRIHYRIRTGDYRIGITIEGDTVTFLRCLPRKDFYKVFP